MAINKTCKTCGEKCNKVISLRTFEKTRAKAAIGYLKRLSRAELVKHFEEFPSMDLFIDSFCFSDGICQKCVDGLVSCYKNIEILDTNEEMKNKFFKEVLVCPTCQKSLLPIVVVLATLD